MDDIRLAANDFKIMSCLQKDPRSSVARIAGLLGMPESTVRHRLNRLIEHRIIEFSAVTNPLRLGYDIWALIEIQVELAKMHDVARRLAAAPEVTFVVITTGSYDILIAAVFRSNAELLDFITKRLSRLPGIIRTSTSSVLELVKRTLAVRLPDSVDNHQPHRSRVARRRARRH